MIYCPDKNRCKSVWEAIKSWIITNAYQLSAELWWSASHCSKSIPGHLKKRGNLFQWTAMRPKQHTCITNSAQITYNQRLGCPELRRLHYYVGSATQKSLTEHRNGRCAVLAHFFYHLAVDLLLQAVDAVIRWDLISLQVTALPCNVRRHPYSRLRCTQRTVLLDYRQDSVRPEHRQ